MLHVHIFYVIYTKFAKSRSSQVIKSQIALTRALLCAIMIGIAGYVLVLYHVDYQWDSVQNVLAFSAKRFLPVPCALPPTRQRPSLCRIHRLIAPARRAALYPFPLQSFLMLLPNGIYPVRKT